LAVVDPRRGVDAGRQVAARGPSSQAPPDCQERSFARLAFSLPQHYGGFAGTVRIYTGAEVFVRDGATLLASSGGAGPAQLPASGSTVYQGKQWLVFSVGPAPPARVYVLAPPATIAASGSRREAGATRMPSSISRTTSPTHSHISAPAAMSHSFTPRSKYAS
jgi:hypothetical protein